jgi:hypothetical protein
LKGTGFIITFGSRELNAPPSAHPAAPVIASPLLPAGTTRPNATQAPQQ